MPGDLVGKDALDKFWLFHVLRRRRDNKRQKKRRHWSGAGRGRMGLVGQDFVLSPTQPRPATRPLFYCSLAARKRHVCRCSTLIAREARRGSTCAGKRGGRGGRRSGVGRLSSAGELVGENYASVRTSWRNIYLAELIARQPVGRIPLRSNCGEKE